MTEYNTMSVWVEVEADFTEAEAYSTSEAQLAQIVAERILSGNITPRIVKCSTVMPQPKGFLPDDDPTPPF